MNGGFGRRASSIVNVRDRTVGLSNVFSGRDLSASQMNRSVAASQQQYSKIQALTQKLGNKFSNNHLHNNNNIPIAE